jgi:hypothetical protein
MVAAAEHLAPIFEKADQSGPPGARDHVERLIREWADEEGLLRGDKFASSTYGNFTTVHKRGPGGRVIKVNLDTGTVWKQLHGTTGDQPGDWSKVGPIVTLTGKALVDNLNVELDDGGPLDGDES